MPNLLKTLAFAALFAAAACSRAGEVWLVDRIEVRAETLAGNPVLPGAADRLGDDLRDALQSRGRFRLLAPAQPPAGPPFPFRLDLEVAFTRESLEDSAGPPQARAEVGVVMHLRRPTTPERYEATGLGRQGFALADPAARTPAFQKALLQALDQVVESQALQLAAKDKPEESLIRDLADKDPRVRSYAARFLGERGAKTAIAALAERLADPDREVAMRALGALGSIGDARALPALVAMPQTRDPQFMRSLVEVVASLGGRDADAFLFTIASGHPDESVRQVAEEAQRRRLAGGRTGPRPDPEEPPP